MSDEIVFAGRVVLVTGAGRGLGRAYARLLAARGAQVVVHDAGVALDGTGQDRTVADTVAAEIATAGGRAFAAYEDLAQPVACAALVTRTMERFGRIDALVHSAGIVSYTGIEATDDLTWERLRRVNIDAPFLLARAVFPHMKRQRYGRIVLTVSGHGLFATEAEDLTAYGMSKAAQFGLMNMLASEGRSHGILANAISPVAATRMYRRRVEPGEAAPELIAPGVVFMASERCSFTAVVLRANDGNFSLGRYAVTAGVRSGRTAVAPEEIAAAWEQITAGPLRGPD